MSVLDRSRVLDVSEDQLDEFTCGICCGIFVDPLETQCCQQIFCKSCITHWLSTNRSCPNDRKPLAVSGLRSPSRLVLNLLNKMQVKCEFHANGCHVITSNELIAKHVSICDKNPNNFCPNCSVAKDNDHQCIDFLVTKVSQLELELKHFGNRDESEEQHYDQVALLNLSRSMKYHATIEENICSNLVKLEQQLDPSKCDEQALTKVTQIVESHLGSSKVCSTGLSALLKLMTAAEWPQSTIRANVFLTLKAMESHPEDYIVQFEAIRLIREVLERMERCHHLPLVRVSLNNIVNFDEHDILIISLALVSNISPYLTIAENSYHGSNGQYMNALLELIKQNEDTDIADNQLVSLPLAIIWTLTDESPETSKLFVSLGGIQLYIDLFLKITQFEEIQRSFSARSLSPNKKIKKSDEELASKLLGGLCNVADVESLSGAFNNKELIAIISAFMESSTTLISFQACGLMANLVAYNVVDNSRIIKKMEETIMKWDPEYDLEIRFRTFDSFWRLMKSPSDVVHLYCLWTINNKLTFDYNYYSKLLIEENGNNKVSSIAKTSKSRQVKKFCDSLLNFKGK